MMTLIFSSSFSFSFFFFFCVFCLNVCSVRASPPRVYVGHSIYKGKAALTVSPRPPEFASLDVCSFYFIFV